MSLHGLCPDTICILYEVCACASAGAYVVPALVNGNNQNNKYVVTSVRSLSRALMQIHRDVM